VFDWTIGRRFFRNWLEESLDAMRRVASERTEQGAPQAAKTEPD
jgi:hypothetical protein